MNQEFRQYRFARIEGQNITKAQLEGQFKGGILDVEQFEQTIAALLAADAAPAAPWRKSEIEQTGYREGVRLAALEFYWAQRHNLRTPLPAPCSRL